MRVCAPGIQMRVLECAKELQGCARVARRCTNQTVNQTRSLDTQAKTWVDPLDSVRLGSVSENSGLGPSVFGLGELGAWRTRCDRAKVLVRKTAVPRSWCARKTVMRKTKAHSMQRQRQRQQDCARALRALVHCEVAAATTDPPIDNQTNRDMLVVCLLTSTCLLAHATAPLRALSALAGNQSLEHSSRMASR